ncbi:MAG: DUF177 domain-containing protein [Bacteroidota bacterium]
MKIQVSGISEGVHHYDLKTDARTLDLGERFPGEVRVAVNLERVGTQVHLRAQASTRGVFECDRCLAPFESLLKASYTMHYLTEGDHGGFDPAEVQIVPSHLGVIDLAEDVRQTVLLAVPLKLLCRPDCAGLCPRCARNLNEGPCGCVDEATDARWEGLRRLGSS